MKVTNIRWNYCPNKTIHGQYGDFIDESWESASIDDRHVKHIEEHRPMGDGDKWFYDVYYDNGTMMRIFNVYIAYYKEEVKP